MSCETNIPSEANELLGIALGTTSVFVSDMHTVTATVIAVYIAPRRQKMPEIAQKPREDLLATKKEPVTWARIECQLISGAAFASLRLSFLSLFGRKACLWAM